MTARRAEPVRHFVWWDDPSAYSKRLQRAACGLWVSPREVVKRDEEITCSGCARARADHAALNLDDGKDANP